MSNISEIIPVFVAAMILVFCSHMRSGYSVSLERYQKKEIPFYMVMAVAMILFVGLRTRYNDTMTYLQGYEMIRPGGSIWDSASDWSLGANPGFNLINILLRRADVSEQNFLMLYAAIMFVALFGTANCFAVFQALSIPWLLQFSRRKAVRC